MLDGSTLRSVILTRRPMRICRGKSVERFADEGFLLIDPSCDLRDEFIETRCAYSAGSGLRGVRQRWRYSEMVARVHRNRFANEFQFARELIELLAHLGQTFIHTGAVVLIPCYVKKTIERGADEPRFRGAAVLGSDCQSRNKILPDVDTDFPLHDTL
jgi:hypothetical protein